MYKDWTRWYHPIMPAEEAFQHLLRDLEMSMSRRWRDCATMIPRQRQYEQTTRWHPLNRASRADHRDRARGLVTRTVLQFWHIHRSCVPGCIPNGRESSLCRVSDQNQRWEKYLSSLLPKRRKYFLRQ